MDNWKYFTRFKVWGDRDGGDRPRVVLKVRTASKRAGRKLQERHGGRLRGATLFLEGDRAVTALVDLGAPQSVSGAFQELVASRKHVETSWDVAALWELVDVLGAAVEEAWS